MNSSDTSQALKLQLLEKDTQTFVTNFLVIVQLNKLKDAISSMASPQALHPYTKVAQINQEWFQKFERKCPTLITHGKRKGQTCGDVSAFFGLYSIRGEVMNPCCSRHSFERHPQYPEYKKAYEEAKREDEARHQKEMETEDAESKQGRQKQVSAFQKLLSRMDAYEQEYGVEDSLQTMRALLLRLQPRIIN